MAEKFHFNCISKFSITVFVGGYSEALYSILVSNIKSLMEILDKASATWLFFHFMSQNVSVKLEQVLALASLKECQKLIYMVAAAQYYGHLVHHAIKGPFSHRTYRVKFKVK